MREPWEVHDLGGVEAVRPTLGHKELGKGLEPPQRAPHGGSNDTGFPGSVGAVDLIIEASETSEATNPSSVTAPNHP